MGIKLTEAERPPVRVICRLDIKGSSLIKGVQFEGLRVVGNPTEYAKRYYADGADEILYIDAVASLYGRSYMSTLLQEAVSDVFIPITVGGGIRSVEDVRDLLRSGADKVAINSEAVRRPQLISEISRTFGEQCTVASIQAKRSPRGGWEVFTDGGRERTGLQVDEWARQVVKLGAGEILITSVDQDGTMRGFDSALVAMVKSEVDVPVIASGGLGVPQDTLRLLSEAPTLDAVSVGSALHYRKVKISQIKSCLKSRRSI